MKNQILTDNHYGMHCFASIHFLIHVSLAFNEIGTGDFKASSCPSGGWTAFIHTDFVISLPLEAARVIEPALFLALCVVFDLPPMQVERLNLSGIVRLFSTGFLGTFFDTP